MRRLFGKIGSTMQTDHGAALGYASFERRPNSFRKGVLWSQVR